MKKKKKKKHVAEQSCQGLRTFRRLSFPSRGRRNSVLVFHGVVSPPLSNYRDISFHAFGGKDSPSLLFSFLSPLLLERKTGEKRDDVFRIFDESTLFLIGVTNNGRKLLYPRHISSPIPRSSRLK